MKKTIALILFIAISTKQYAQIEKGTYVPSISVNGNYTTSPTKDTVSSNKNNKYSITTNLGFGRFIKDNLLLTGTFSYGHSGSKSDYTNNQNHYYNKGSNSFGNTESIGVSLLKYKFITENFAIRYGASCSVSYNELISRSYQYQERYNNSINAYEYIYLNGTSYSNSLGAQLNLLAGIQYFVSKNLALTGNMGFFNVSDNYSPYQKAKHINASTLTFTLTPSFNAFSAGLTYYFRQKVVAGN
jgi:hypothetical protein